MDESSLDLPPGFRFHPTDEELISHYLTPKILNHGAFATVAIGEADLNRCEPWDLPGKAKMGEKEWYFFCQRDRKYPTGMRTNRATESGYWKATGKDKEIFKGRGFLIGMKKTLVFYRGRAPKGEKSNWVMHEFRLEGKSSSSSLPKFTKDEWVVCRVFHKNNPSLKKSPVPAACSFVRPSGCFANELTGPNSLPPLMDTVPLFNSAGAFAASSPPPLLSDFYYSAHGAHAAYPAAMKRQQYCKAEGAQFSNQSMLSQDTGDRYTEISSVISKMDMASCASYGGAGVIDLHDLASMFR